MCFLHFNLFFYKRTTLGIKEHSCISSQCTFLVNLDVHDAHRVMVDISAEEFGEEAIVQTMTS